MLLTLIFFYLVVAFIVWLGIPDCTLYNPREDPRVTQHKRIITALLWPKMLRDALRDPYNHK